jgi:hypothetical protein
VALRDQFAHPRARLRVIIVVVVHALSLLPSSLRLSVKPQ